MRKKLRSLVLDVVAIAVAIPAIIVGGHTLLDYISVGRASEADGRPVDEWDSLISDGRWLGATDPVLTVLEWGDYECPACGHFHKHLKAVMRKYPTQVALVYRHWPLPYHENAYVAARAAECAGDQENFEAVHNVLLESFSLSRTFLLDEVPTLANIPDLNEYRECLTSTEDVARIERDIAAVEGLNARGTPALVINGIYESSPPDSIELERRVLELIDSDGS